MTTTARLKQEIESLRIEALKAISAIGGTVAVTPDLSLRIVDDFRASRVRIGELEAQVAERDETIAQMHAYIGEVEQRLSDLVEHIDGGYVSGNPITEARLLLSRRSQ